MKIARFLLLLILTTVCHKSLCQDDYDRGFKAGHKEGYCYGLISCIAPIPPLTPIPQIGESNNNYRDGYNRGFKRGLEDRERNKSSSSSNIRIQQDNSGRFQQMGENRWKELQMMYNLSENMRIEAQRVEELRKQKSIALLEQTKRIYNEYSKFPSVSNGEWYNVVVTNGYDFCEQRKVRIADNKVVSYVINNFIRREVIFSSDVKDCRCVIKTKYPNGGDSDFLDVYFIERVLEPTSTSTTPENGGSVSFFTNYSRAGNVSVSVDSEYIGSLNLYFDKGTPVCWQEGTVTIELKAGIHNYTATNGRDTWKSSVLVYPNQCVTQLLSK